MRAALTGRVVTAEFSDGIALPCADCEGSESCCGCCESVHRGRPAGTYVTVRLDDEDARIGLGRVTVTYEEAA